MFKRRGKLSVRFETLRNLRLLEIKGGVITGGTVEATCDCGQTNVACGPTEGCPPHCATVFYENSCVHASYECSMDC
jgi:hypothetical protein